MAAAHRDDAPNAPTSTRLKLRLMGAPHITWDGEPLQTDTKKAIALLSYLAMRPGPQSRDHLASLLWTSPETARNKAALRRTLSTLRKALQGDEQILQATRQTIGLQSDEVDVDARRFLSILAPSGDEPPSQDALHEAIAMHQGPFLDGFYLQESTPFEGWCADITQELQTAYRRALLWAMDDAEAHEDWSQAIHLAQQALLVDALDEPIYQRLIRYLIANGQRADALEQYELCRQQLAEGLNLKPSEETRALLSALQQPNEAPSESITPEHETTTGPTGAGATAPTPQPQPSQPTPDESLSLERGDLLLAPLFGREEALAALVKQLAEPSCLWLTLKGPAGSGKSHLARHLAAQPGQPPTLYVDVHALTQAKSTDTAPFFQRLDSAASSLLAQASASSDAIDDAKSPHRLIIDHFPPSLCGEEPWRSFGRRWPSIQRLLVARHHARIRGEWVYDLDELPLGAKSQAADWREGPAPALLQWYARQQRQDVALQPEDQRAIEALYGLVGGHPLGLQMAAGWLRVLSPEALVEELRQDLSILELPSAQPGGEALTWKALFHEAWTALDEGTRGVCRAMVERQQMAEESGWLSTDEWLALPGASLPLLLSLRDQGWIRQRAQEQVALWQIMASSIAQWG